jgi:hypothetical protein
LAQYKTWRSGFLLTASLLLLESGCGLDHYEQQMEREQQRLQYLDDQNQNLEANPLKWPEKKGEDKEAVGDKDFFFRPPKGISTTPEPMPMGMFYRYSSTDPTGNLQDLLVAFALSREGTEKFRNEVLRNLESFGLRAAGPIKSREAGLPIGQPIRYDFYELQGPPNQAGGSVYFYHEPASGDAEYQVALVFRGTPSSPGGIPNDSAVMELTLGSLRVGNVARIRFSQYKPAPTPTRRYRRY